MASNGITRDPNIIGKISKEACYVCTPGTNFELCKTFPSTKDDSECRKACQDQYGAKTYFYDKDGTQQCYCGKTTVDCDQYKQVETCTNNSKKECVLVTGSSINNEKVPRDITSSQQCTDVCNKILRADGLYCDNKCICTNPSVSPVDPDEIKKIERHIRSTCDSKDTLFCTDTVTPVQTKKTAPSDIFPENYFKYGSLLPNENSVKNAFCGCDQSVIEFYNLKFPKNPKPTLGKIWQEAVQNIQTQDPNKSDKTTELYSEFSKVLIKYASYPNEKRLDPEKVKALIAYEMCRVTNDKYERKKEPVKEPVFTGPWLEWHLNPESDSGKWLNRGVKILVMGMLLHILMRTLIPKGGNISESLLYAMYLPHKFLQNRPLEKTGIMGGSIFLMIIIIGFIYLSGNANPPALGFFIVSLIISLILFIYTWIKKSKYINATSAFIIILLLSFFVIATENPKLSKEVKHFGTASIILSVTCGLLVLPLLYGVIKKNTPWGYPLIMSSLALISVLIFIILIMNYRKSGTDEGEALLKFYIPSSFSKLPTSGLALSIYAIIIGASLTRINVGGGLGLAGILVAIALFSGLIMYFMRAILKINILITPFSAGYYGILAGFIGISLLSSFISFKLSGNTYFMSYILSTFFGVLPLSVFTIIMNFAIASYSPGIELLFLVIYRISGFILARNPNSGLGKLLIMLLGKRSSDKWVMPFLPIISNFIKLFYSISGDNLPGYFTTTSAITGVSNTDMWLS